MRIFWFVSWILASSVVANAQARELAVDADLCAILAAFQVAEDSCVTEVGFGPTRSIPPAVLPDRGAYPPDALNSENGYFIRFAFDSQDLTPAYRDHLMRLAQVFSLPQTQALCFRLVGHTDSSGSASYNQSLSEARAKTVHLFLVGVAGVEPHRLEAAGRGEQALLPHVPAGHGLNRRVEILARPMVGDICSG